LGPRLVEILVGAQKAFAEMSSEPNSPQQDRYPASTTTEFARSTVGAGLERIRARLLDLTNRNKLLNFRHSSTSSLRIVDVHLETVFQRLMDGGRLYFMPVPEPGETESADKPAPGPYAETLGWRTSFELDVLALPQQYDGSLPVLQYAEHLDAISRKITSTAKTVIEESGTNMLYLTMGFLEWYESDDSREAHYAPLVAIPVTIERRISKGKAYRCEVEYSGEDLETNLSLVEKMRQDLGLDIPTIKHEQTPEEYFLQLSDLLTLKRRWKIRREMSLCLLSFGKLLMFRDLDPKNWPSDSSISRHPLVRELFEGAKNFEQTRAEEFAIDAPELKRELPDLVLDADSSQHSALIHALRGQNLVLEGPPGTGKSQTITNLIAAAMASGKTVLFIAEKLAALEVVRSRLDQIGLGLFCLELHSHKTKKGALLQDVAQRLNKSGTYREPRDLELQIAIAEDKKRRLIEYVSLISKVIEPLQSTVFDILWARDRALQELPFGSDSISHLILPFLTQFSRSEYLHSEQFLAVYAQHLSSIVAPSQQLNEQPWAWVNKPLSFDEEQACLGFVDTFLTALRNARRCFGLIQDTIGLSLSTRTQDLQRVRDLAAALPLRAGALKDVLLVPCNDAITVGALAQFVKNVEDFRNASGHISAAGSHGVLLFEPNTAERLRENFHSLQQLGLEDYSFGDLKTAYRQNQAAQLTIEQAPRSFSTVISLLGFDALPTLETLGPLLMAYKITEEDLPVEILHLRSASLQADGTAAHLRAARQLAEGLRGTRAQLSLRFSMSFVANARSSEDFSNHARVIATTPFVRRWGNNYRNALNAYRNVVLTGRTASRDRMTQDFRDLADYCARHAAFETNETYRSGFGPHFVGIATPWNNLLQLAGWYEKLFVTFPENEGQSRPFREFFLSARAERIKAVRDGLRGTTEHRAILENAISSIARFGRMFSRQCPAETEATLHEFSAALKKVNEQVSAALAQAEALGLKDELAIRTLPALIAAALECRRAIQGVTDDKSLVNLLGADFKAMDTDIAPIKATVQFASSIAHLPAKAVAWLLDRQYEQRLEQLRVWFTRAEQLLDQLCTVSGDLARLSGSSAWNENLVEYGQRLEALAQQAHEHPDELDPWVQFLRIREESDRLGFQKLTLLADQKAFEPQYLTAAFALVFYNTLARSVLSAHPSLSNVTGRTLDELRQQFAKADREIIRLCRERFAAQIDRRPVPSGNHTGPVGEWTERGLLIHEIKKQKKHIPIRELTRRAGRALLGLKPCFMMGPLSVAQYLAPGHLKFDLIVMDEASQLKPEDAIGAMGRGAQVVIVGDPKQLPPTTFFQRVQLDGDGTDEDQTMAVEESESILDIASTLYHPIRRLRWHYRSRHQDLIAFSNHEFYQGDLVIFPSASHHDDSLGVKYHPITNGIFENRRNAVEAGVVVQAVVDHMKNNPNESLGVVTLNFEQRELVEELLDQRLSRDPLTLSYQERMTGPESVFIKNLENVQGDERDVIFISVTYGPDALGNQFQRFGPINGEQGHRRLNVLFTRAKKRVVVFSSLDPDKIQVTPNSPWGVRALKQYLTFARSGILEGAEQNLDQPTNDFETSVGAVLKEKGFQVMPQVGVAGFFIDLGVIHPLKMGTFLLGIECDGAGYHSGRSARDRDRLRQEILQNLGWKIHRIWSTDWFKNREAEIRRLLKRIDELQTMELQANEHTGFKPS
jgi:very-short-patch-repair endonuclease